MSKSWKVVASEAVYQGPAFRVRHDQLELEQGKRIVRAVVEHPGAVVIIPKTAAGSLLLLRQYRHSVGQTLLEFPAGTLEVGEDPIVTAKREIIEETGFAAAKWTTLGTLLPAPGFCDELQHCYLAEGLSADARPGDEDEIIEVVAMSVAEVESEILSGVLVDAKSIAIFCRARLRNLL